jgi:endonuclease G
MKSPASDELRYGMPQADQILRNRHYTLGYSYYFRQAKWALEIIDPGKVDIERIDNFRPDYRIPSQFRADLAHYTSSGYDRGHLVASANQNEAELQNSETFLLSNMSPQQPQFNRGIWRKLEAAIRKLDADPDIWETYVICGPVFYFDTPVENISSEELDGVSIPIPNAYFKSILTEDKKGRLKMWSFLLPNEASNAELDTFIIPTKKIEKYTGLELWNELRGPEVEKEKGKTRSIWSY